ncbi:MAG: S41 family peptidase, partial [Candidatus Omnitrophota bacterium]
KDSGMPGVMLLQITHFNQVTSPDFADEVSLYGTEKLKHLILDLRANEGGPPLAAREILGFFLPKDDPLFGIARKKQRPVLLSAPEQKLSIRCPVTVLVNRRTGSAAEMFSGMLQAKKVATLVGQKTAGATYLKSMYDYEDGATIFMITSLTFFYNRRIYPVDGLTPDVLLDEQQNALDYALRQFSAA